jgi:hypothetical protein
MESIVEAVRATGILPGAIIGIFYEDQAKQENTVSYL